TALLFSVLLLGAPLHAAAQKDLQENQGFNFQKSKISFFSGLKPKQHDHFLPLTHAIGGIGGWKKLWPVKQGEQFETIAVSLQQNDLSFKVFDHSPVSFDLAAVAAEERNRDEMGESPRLSYVQENEAVAIRVDFLRLAGRFDGPKTKLKDVLFV